MANGVTHWGVEGAKNGSNNGATPENKNKTIYYYAAGALTLLLAVKLLSSSFFREAIDFSITYLPFVLLLGVIASNIRKYHKHPENGEAIRKNALHKLLYLLLITLLFYILYSPGSFVPIGEAISKFSRLSSLENYFLVLAYACVIIIALAPIAFFIRVYQKSNGYYKGSLRDSARHLLYSVFFVFVLIFVSSILTYPSAYAPITGYVSNAVYSVFLKPDNANTTDNLAQSRISTIKSALGKTYNNLTESFSDSNEKLSTTIADTKSSLDTAIARTNKSLKNSLSEDIEAKFDISGGILEGDLTIEDDLVVEGQSTFANVIPASDDAYDLGSVTKGWEHIYAGFLHGSSLLTVGDGSSSHSLSATDDFLVSGDFEVNGTSYLDGATTIGGAINLNGAVTFGGTISAGGAIISNVADPANPQDAVTKAYYLANTPAGVFTRNSGTGKLYPTTDGDYLDMLTGYLTVGTANITTLDLGTNTITDGNLTGAWTGITSLNTTISSTELGYLDGVTSAIQTQFSGKEPTIGAGSASQYLKGDKSLGTFNTDVRDAISVSGGLLGYNSGTGVISLSNSSIDHGSIGGLSDDDHAQYALLAGRSTSQTLIGSTGSGYNLTLVGGTQTNSDLVLKTTTGVAASGADMLFQTGSNGLTEAMKIDYNGVTYINSLQSGAQSFETNAGIVQWADMQVTSSAADNTVESYSAMLDGSAVLTVYGLSDGAGAVDNIGVGIRNSAPGALLDIGTAGSILGTLRLEGNTSGYVQMQTAAAAGSWTMTLPANDGDAGQQLQTDGNGITSWAAAGSLRSMKNVSGTANPKDALKQILSTNVYKFHYKEGMGTQDSETNYVGVMADEAPWAMHFGGTIINPVNTLGYMILGMRAEDEKIVNAQAKIADIETQTAGLTLKTDTNATTVSELQASVDEQLASIDDELKAQGDLISENTTNIGNLETEVADLKTDLQAQIDELKIKANSELSMAQIDLNKADIALIKQTLGMDTADAGDLSIIGQIAAKKIVVEEAETGKITITINEDAPTIGEGSIAVGEKSAVIKTGAVTENSKIFVTPDQPVKVGVTIDFKSNDKSFTIETDEEVAGKDLKVSWWIVETN